jgi:Ca-activated chloride channel family protein
VVRFGGRILDERTVTVRDRDDLADLDAFVSRGRYDDATAVWSALDHGYATAQRALAEVPGRTVSIVLMTDGENNAGLGTATFDDRYRARPAASRAVPTYPVYFGDADGTEPRRVAALTGGRVVDARKSSLSTAFKEIRGCH